MTRLGIRMKRLRIMNRFKAACQLYLVICNKKLVPQGHNKDKIEPLGQKLSARGPPVRFARGFIVKNECKRVPQGEGYRGNVPIVPPCK